jgi:hypothetical protein
MAESARGLARAVERRRKMLNTVFALNVEEYLEDGRRHLILRKCPILVVNLELADLVVYEDV